MKLLYMNSNFHDLNNFEFNILELIRQKKNFFFGWFYYKLFKYLNFITHEFNTWEFIIKSEEKFLNENFMNFISFFKLILVFYGTLGKTMPFGQIMFKLQQKKIAKILRMS